METKRSGMNYEIQERKRRNEDGEKLEFMEVMSVSVWKAVATAMAEVEAIKRQGNPWWQPWWVWQTVQEV